MPVPDESYRYTVKPVLFQICNEWLISRREHCKPSSMRIYERAVRQLYEIFGKDSRLDHMTAKEIKDRIFASHHGHARSYINQLIKVVNAAQKFAVKEGMAKRMVPVERVRSWVPANEVVDVPEMPHYRPRFEKP